MNRSRRLISICIALCACAAACEAAVESPECGEQCDEGRPDPLPARHLAANEHPSGWTNFSSGDGIRQRFLIEDDLIFTETAIVIRATPQQIVAALRGDWSRWWQGGEYELLGYDCDTRTECDRELPADGRPDTVDYALWPAGKLGGIGIRAHERIHPPRTQADGSLVVDIDLDDCCVGPAYFQIVDMEDGWLSVYGVFNGVADNTLLFTTGQLAKNHLRAEAGTLRDQALGSLFPDGTGLPGLIRCLELDDADCLAAPDAPPGT